MNRSSALTIFNLDSDSADLEEIRDAYEQAVFEISNRFLRNHPQPLLVRAKIKRLHTLSEAWIVLTGENQGPLPDLPERKLDLGGLEPLLRSYETHLAGLRTELAKSREALAAAAVMERMAEFQEQWDKELMRRFPLEEDQWKGMSVQQMPDTVAMMKVISENGEEQVMAGESLHLQQPFISESARIHRQNSRAN
ncbi:MAG: hypothetical protein ACK40M_14320 [Flavobacteriales bacterium]